ncbi:hypothetical protein ACFP3I_10860 [Chryseobacterium arachidis]
MSFRAKRSGAWNLKIQFVQRFLRNDKLTVSLMRSSLSETPLRTKNIQNN